MKTAIIVQARMTSTRLPGKVLMPVMGRPLLAYALERLKRARNAPIVLVATTANATDDPIAALCGTLDTPVFRGDEADVLGRYHAAATRIGADIIVRVTADCPLIDPAVVDTLIDAYLNAQPRCDYVSNTLERSFPRGLDAEVFSMAALAAAHREAIHPDEREHVTPFMYRRPERFRLRQLAMPHATPADARHRWTVDTPADFALIERVLEALYPQQPNFGYRDVLALLAHRPDWVALNADVAQKPLSIP